MKDRVSRLGWRLQLKDTGTEVKEAEELNIKYTWNEIEAEILGIKAEMLKIITEDQRA